MRDAAPPPARVARAAEAARAAAASPRLRRRVLGRSTRRVRGHGCRRLPRRRRQPVSGRATEDPRAHRRRTRRFRPRSSPTRRRSSGARDARHAADRAPHRVASRCPRDGHPSVSGHPDRSAARARHARSRIRVAGGDGRQGGGPGRPDRGGRRVAPAACRRTLEGLRDRRRQPPCRLCLLRDRASHHEGCGVMAVAPLTLRPPLPRSLYVETTSRCNSKCQTCILTFGGREPAEDLTWPRFRQIVDQFPALERVLLHGIGEPLLNPDLPRMIEHLVARGAHVLFNSNAISLSRAQTTALIDAGLHELQVSLDASTRETYARVWSACRRPWTLAYVTVHGNVLPCCIAPWITTHYDGIVLGNIFRESIEEIWWGRRYQDFRQAIQTDTPPEPCVGCGVRWSL